MFNLFFSKLRLITFVASFWPSSPKNFKWFSLVIFLAIPNNWDPLIASVDLSLTAPGATFLSWRSNPAAPKETISPAAILSPPLQVYCIDLIVAPICFFPGFESSAFAPPPIAIALSSIAVAPEPIATVFTALYSIFSLVPIAPAVAAVPIAKDKCPATALTPRATAPWPDIVFEYSGLKISTPVKFFIASLILPLVRVSSALTYDICWEATRFKSSPPIAIEEWPSDLVLPPIDTDWSPFAQAPWVEVTPPPIAIDWFTA